MADTYEGDNYGGGDEMYTNEDEFIDGGVREDVSRFILFQISFFDCFLEFFYFCSWIKPAKRISIVNE